MHRRSTVVAVQHGTHLANWPCLEVQEVISFCGHSKCSTLHNGRVILLHDDASPHMARQTWKLLQKSNWETDHPPHIPDLVPTDFHLKEHLSGLFHLHLRHQMCYHYLADATGTHSMHLGWTDLSYAMTGALTFKRTVLKNSIPVTNFIVFYQFPVLNSYL
jgi:hypothetical protein